MQLTARRLISNHTATTSLVFIDSTFECFGLEDEYRKDKVLGETRIPAGEYPVRVRNVGGFHNRYSKRFSYHQGMLEVCNVPGFSDILIHIGNTEEDTSGCLLVGHKLSSSNPYFIGSSTLAYTLLYQKVIQAALDGDLTIKYIDEDR